MRYFIYLAYDGTNYHGWQIQPNGDSVQETLMRAFSTFLRQEIEVVGQDVLMPACMHVSWSRILIMTRSWIVFR